MKKAKTVRQILNMAKTTLYLTAACYNRAYAFTLFMKELEKKAKEENVFFQIVNTHVVRAQCRHIKNRDYRETPSPDPKTEMPLLKYVSFAYGKERFYMQFDDNPFFEAYIKRYSEIIHHESYREPELHEIETGHIRIFNDIEIEKLWSYNGMRNINFLKKHLLEKFKEMQKQPKIAFWKSRKKNLNQTIYTR